ncbi:MAG: hypothetical protein AAFO69_05240 [Bacteroidota bacterium]
MKKFKLIYYILYGLVVLLILYIASNVIGVMETIREWGWFTYYASELPIIASRFYYFIGIVMVIAVGIENYFTFQKRKERKDLEQEVTRLKAKLYDKEEELQAIQSSNIAVEPITYDAPDGIPAAEDIQSEEDETSKESDGFN